jgi:hypothetical protein
MQRALVLLGSGLLATTLAAGCGSCGGCNSCGWGGGSASYHSHGAPSYGGPALAPQSGGVYYQTPAQPTTPSTNGSYNASPTPATPAYQGGAYQGAGSQ